MRGLIGRIVARGVEDDDDDVVIRSSRKFDVVRSAERSAQSFTQTYGNLLSCFTLQGEFGLWSTMQNYLQSKGLVPEVLEAVEDGDEAGYMKAIFKSQQRAFHDLYTKGAIHRLLLAVSLPRAAMDEWLRMEQSVDAVTASNADPSAVQTPVVPVVTESPVEACVRDFKEMPSNQWKKKWLLDQRNRPIADLAVAEGRI